MAVCISCNKKVEDFIKFKCPECGTDVIRCQHCRSLGVTFKCSNKKCSFEGP